MARSGRRAFKVKLVLKALLVPTAPLDHKARKAKPVHKDHKEFKATLDRKDPQGLTVRWERKAKSVPKGLWVRLAQSARKATSDLRARRVMWVLLGRRGLTVLRVLKATLDLLVLTAQLDHRAKSDHKALKARKVQPARTAHQAQMDRMEPLARMVQSDRKVK